MRIPDENVEEGRQNFCKCCALPIYERPYPYCCSIESLSKVAISLSIFFSFLIFLSGLTSRRPAVQLLPHRHLFGPPIRGGPEVLPV